MKFLKIYTFSLTWSSTAELGHSSPSKFIAGAAGLDALLEPAEECRLWLEDCKSESKLLLEVVDGGGGGGLTGSGSSSDMGEVGEPEGGPKMSLPSLGVGEGGVVGRPGVLLTTGGGGGATGGNTGSIILAGRLGKRSSGRGGGG